MKFADIIIQEHDQYIVINKPSGLSSLSDRAQTHNLLDWGRDYHPDIQLCHRLDKETSGIMLLAKDAEFYRHVALQFQNREVAKVYHALVEGRHLFDNKKVDLPLAMGRRGIAHVGGRSAKESLTWLHTLDQYKAHSLIECKPVTGRTHQIRAHLAHFNAPLIADTSYGGQPFFLSQIKPRFNLKKYSEERPLMSRLALHAKAISFQDLAGEKHSFEAPYPKDFAVMLKQLDKNRTVYS